jgi:uncharacterized membrane protein (DUF4010 family)
MARWILLAATLGAILVMLFGPSPGWVALGVFGFLFGSIATTLAFAHARIAFNARQEEYEGYRMSRAHGRPPTATEADDPAD